MREIKWYKGLEEAEREIKGSSRYVLMFFHHPQCGGCKKTIEQTYKDQDVAAMIGDHFAPVSFLVTEDQDVTARYNIEWTPTFIIADENGIELSRWVGYLPPEEFINQVHLAEGHVKMKKQMFKEAEKDFEWIIDHKPSSQAAPEARYYMGVALYKDTGDPGHLKRTWEEMRERYPGNSWTTKASAWS